MKKYRRVCELVQALKRGEIPDDVVSPGTAVEALGVSRQRVAKLVRVGKLEAWGAEGVVLIDPRSVRAYVRSREKWLQARS